MLKITVDESPEKVTYKLEGKLIGAYACELQKCAESKSKPIVVDLRSVDFIDDEGRRVLKGLHQRGAKFIKGGPLVCAILDRIVKAGVLALLFLPVRAQTTGTLVRLTLHDAIETALKQNPQIAIANLQLAESQEQANVSRAGLLPQVGLGVSESVHRVNIQAQIGVVFPNFPQHIGPFWNSQAGTNFSVPLLDLTAFRRWQAAKEDITGARAQETSVREQNVQLVVSQYLGSLRAGADVGAARSRMDVAKALLDLATDLQRNGAGTRIDTLRADVQYQNERQRLIVSETEFQTSVYALARLLNIDPRTPVELTDQNSFFETPTAEGNNTVEAAFSNRPELQGVESRLRSLELQRSAAKDARLPRLSVTGGWAELGLTPTSVIPTYTYSANLEVPLFTGGRIRAEEALAGLEVRRVEQERQDLRNRISLEVQTANAQLQAARTQVDVANHALDLAREELTQARDRFQAGVANNIEVIQAQDEVARANDNQIQALYRYNQARADLARATGQIERIYSK